MTVVGVDACSHGWVAVCLDADGTTTPARGVFARTLDELAAAIPDAEGFAVDIPIGLPTAGHRRADLEARDLLEARRNSVFLTPVREALEAPTHAEASALARSRTGQGISRQSYALRDKIFEAERWRAVAPVPVWEVHPEVSFALLLGHPARWSKKTWAGTWERLTALRQAGIDLGAVGDAGGFAAPDDVLDAAAAAWSARRLVAGEAMSLPDPPEVDPATGDPVAIWA
jgi:predicted RNase H-like nuclease